MINPPTDRPTTDQANFVRKSAAQGVSGNVAPTCRNFGTSRTLLHGWLHWNC